MATLAEKITTVNIDAPAEYTVKGKTTEQVLRDLLADASIKTAPVIGQLVARFDAKAAKRAAKGSGDEEGEG